MFASLVRSFTAFVAAASICACSTGISNVNPSMPRALAPQATISVPTGYLLVAPLRVSAFGSSLVATPFPSTCSGVPGNTAPAFTEPQSIALRPNTFTMALPCPLQGAQHVYLVALNASIIAPMTMPATVLGTMNVANGTATWTAGPSIRLAAGVPAYFYVAIK